MCDSAIQLTDCPADTAWCEPGNTITLRVGGRAVSIPRGLLHERLQPFVVDEELPKDHHHVLMFERGSGRYPGMPPGEYYTPNRIKYRRLKQRQQ